VAWKVEQATVILVKFGSDTNMDGFRDALYSRRIDAECNQLHRTVEVDDTTAMRDLADKWDGEIQ
jgi:hypothetical protein